MGREYILNKLFQIYLKNKSSFIDKPSIHSLTLIRKVFFQFFAKFLLKKITLPLFELGTAVNNRLDGIIVPLRGFLLKDFGHFF